MSQLLLCVSNEIVAMKGPIVFIFILFYCSSNLFALPTPNGVFLYEGLEKVNTRAWRAGKMIFVDFTAQWCLPCKMMEEKTFKHPEVSDVLRKDFIAVQYDIQASYGASLRNEYAIQSLPTILVLHPDGTELKRLQGSISASELLTELYSVLRTHRIEKQEYYGLERPALRPAKQLEQETETTQKTLQLGLFSNRDNALKLQLQMPVQTKIVLVEKEGRQFWAVVSERKGSAGEMKVLKASLQKRGIPCFLIEGPS